MIAFVENTFPLLGQIRQGSLVQFGVFSANTMLRLAKGAVEQGNPFKTIWGFDSFVGLPAEADGVWKNPEWPEGAFNLLADYKLETVEDGLKFVRNRMSEGGFDNTVFIDGFFSDTLQDFNFAASFLNDITYVDIDVDIYQSTKEVLDFLFGYKLIKRGTIIRYDDWGSTPWTGGNRLAHSQASDKYNLSCHFALDGFENVFVVDYYKGITDA